MIGADTGFFFALREGDHSALRVFEEEDVAASALTLFELKRLAFRKNIPWSELGSWLERSVTILEVTARTADEAAAIAHSTGLPAIDALIIASLASAGCRIIYTRDEHFERFSRPGIAVIRL
jgi:predicted nucleic acid-binding protein